MNEDMKDRLEYALMDNDLLPKYIRVEEGATDRQDESATYYTTIHLEPALDIESCRHEHDCCGGWYQGGITLAHKYGEQADSTTLLFSVDWAMNV